MIESFYYLALLTGSLLCLTLLDRRFKLALFHDRNRTIRVLLIALCIFLVWDLIGIHLNIFYVGNSNYLTGLRILPEVPIEELFFLLLLNYNALLLWRGGVKVWQRT